MAQSTKVPKDHPQAVELLKRAFEEDPDPLVRREAARVIEWLRGAEDR